MPFDQFRGFRARALGTTALVAIGSIALPNGAQAACNPTTTPTSGQTVVCDGTTNDNVVAQPASTDVTVIIDDGAALNAGTSDAVTVRDQSDIQLLDNAQVTTGGGIFTRGLYADGNSNTVSLNQGAQIDTNSTYSRGISAYGDGNTLTLNGADVDAVGTGGGAETAVGILTSGVNNQTTLNNGTLVRADGNDASGIAAWGNNGTITLNTASSVESDAPGERSLGVFSGFDAGFAAPPTAPGSGHSIVLNDASSVNSTSTGGNSVAALLISDGGDITLNGGSSLNAHSDSGYVLGAFVYESSNSSVTLNDMSTITGTGGTIAVGIALGNANAQTDTTVVTLNGGSTISTQAAGDTGGVYLKGLDNTVSLNGGSSIVANSTNGRAGGIYGPDGGGYAGATIELNDASSITATGLADTGGIALGFDPSGVTVGHDNGTITLSGGSTVDATSSLVAANGIYLAGENATINVNGNSRVSGTSAAWTANGIYVSGPSATLTLNGSSATGTGPVASTGIYVVGTGATIVLNENASVAGQSQGVTTGLLVNGDNGASTITDSSVTGSSTGGAAAGLSAVGDGHSVSLSGSTVSAESGGGNIASAVFVGSGTSTSTASIVNSVLIANAPGGGGATGIVMDDNAFGLDVVGTTIDVDGDGATAGIAIGGDGTVTIDAGTVINATGAFARAVSSSTAFLNSGRQTLINAGTLNASSGIAIELDDLDDTLVLQTGSTLGGSADGGAGTDALILQGEGSEDDDFLNFETLAVDASTTWNLSGGVPLSGPGTAAVNSGTLLVNGTLTAPGGTTVSNGATLGGSGTLTSDVIANGTINPGNSPGTTTVSGSVTFNPGSTLIVEIDPTGNDLLQVVGTPGTVTINGGTVVPVITGVSGGVVTFLTATGGITGTFDDTSGFGSALSFGPTGVTLVFSEPGSVNSAAAIASGSGFLFLDAVKEEARGADGRVWLQGIYESSDREGEGTASGFDQDTFGTAGGGDLFVIGPVAVGVAAGYLNSDAGLSNGTGGVEADGYHGAVYGTYRYNAFSGEGFVTAAITAAYQDQKSERIVLSNGSTMVADGDIEAIQYGGLIEVGHIFDLVGNWDLTPSFHAGFLRTDFDGYTESGAGAASFVVDDIESEEARVGADLELGVDIKAPDALWVVRPFLAGGVAQEWKMGDDTSRVLTGDGATALTLSLDERDQTVYSAGAGIEAGFANGLTAFARYDGDFGTDEVRDGFFAGLSFKW